MNLDEDIKYIGYAEQLAVSAEREGNLPIGCVIVLDGEVISEGANAVFAPVLDPGRHAEMVYVVKVKWTDWGFF